MSSRRLIGTPPALRRALLAPRAPGAICCPRHSSSLPTVATGDFWRSMIPKPFRREEKLPDDPMIKRVKPKRSKEWNPATFYIVIYLLIGSMAINMISLRQNFEAFMRQTDVRIRLLKEVVERIQKGETVDVEKALGTGDPEKEQEWADILQEIQREEVPKSRKQSWSRSAPADAAKPAAPETPATEAVKTQQSTGMSSFF